MTRSCALDGETGEDEEDEDSSPSSTGMVVAAFMHGYTSSVIVGSNIVVAVTSKVMRLLCGLIGSMAPSTKTLIMSREAPGTSLVLLLLISPLPSAPALTPGPYK